MALTLGQHSRQSSIARATRSGGLHVHSRSSTQPRRLLQGSRQQLVLHGRHLAGAPLVCRSSADDEMVRQASEAVKRALDAGATRQTLTLLLPINEKESDFCSTEPIDYPCSLQKEFETAVSLAKSLLAEVCGAGTELKVQRIDDGGVEGEPCAAVYTADKKFVAVVYPTAERLKDIRKYAEAEGRSLLMIVNPQWRTEGNVVSDFGIGPWKKAAEDFLGTFTPSYSLYEQRIGSPGSINPGTGARFLDGGVVRPLLAYPRDYQVFAMSPDGASQMLARFGQKPTYQQLDAALRDGRKAGLEIFKVASIVSNVYAERGDGEDLGVAAAEVDGLRVEDVGRLTPDLVDAMDAVGLRKTLTRLGLPTSGKLSKLRERLKAAVAEAQQ